MNSPFHSNTPEDVRPYVPSWSRPQSARSGGGYDIFSDEENPSYREMAQMFSPQPPAEKRKTGQGKLLVRFLGVVGVAATVLALFVGYVVTQPREGAVASRDADKRGVGKALDAVQATFSASLPKTSPNEAPKTAEVKPAPAPEPSAAPKALENRSASAEPRVVKTEPVAPVQAAPPPVQVSAPQVPSPPQIAALVVPSEPAIPPAPIAPELTAGELATLMSRGRQFVENGDFASARPVYRRAAEAGYAEAALALGETYDPRALSEKGAIGISPNVEEARRWYRKAQDLGSLEAPTRLERLPGN